MSRAFPPAPLLIGALLRVPAQAIHRRLIEGLNATGFDELRLPHMVVFQFPGPEGVSPGVLAELVRLGVQQNAIAISAFGDTRPLVPTAAGVREPQNRRVEIVLK